MISPSSRASELEKLKFRLSQPGLRRLPATLRRTALAKSDTALGRLASVVRRSHRTFRAGAIDFDTFGGFLECLTSHVIPDAPFPKYWYGSAGNLYPVRIHLYVKSGCVDRVARGYYYHDPAAHDLVTLGETPPLEAWQFGPNGAIFGEASFSLFFTAHMNAITPEYGDSALRFTLIEAGLMTQLLELRAAELGLGTCQFGGGVFASVRRALQLESDAVILHTVVVGLPAE